MPRHSKQVIEETIRALKSGRSTATVRRLVENGQAAAMGYHSPRDVYNIDVAEMVIYRQVCLRHKQPLESIPKLRTSNDFSQWLTLRLKTTGFFSS